VFPCRGERCPLRAAPFDATRQPGHNRNLCAQDRCDGLANPSPVSPAICGHRQCRFPGSLEDADYPRNTHPRACVIEILGEGNRICGSPRYSSRRAVDLRQLTLEFKSPFGNRSCGLPARARPIGHNTRRVQSLRRPECAMSYARGNRPTCRSGISARRPRSVWENGASGSQSARMNRSSRRVNSKRPDASVGCGFLAAKQALMLLRSVGLQNQQQRGRCATSADLWTTQIPASTGSGQLRTSAASDSNAGSAR